MIHKTTGNRNIQQQLAVWCQRLFAAPQEAHRINNIGQQLKRTGWQYNSREFLRIVERRETLLTQFSYHTILRAIRFA